MGESWSESPPPAGKGAPAKARILFVADQALLRESVSRVLNTEEDLQVVAGCGSMAAALEILASRPVDLVLLDIDLRQENGLRFPARAREGGYEGALLVVTAGVSEEEAVELVRQGVAGIFLKHERPEALVECIRSVLRGGAWLDRRTLAALLGTTTTPTGPVGEDELTEREREVLRAVFEGLANKEIAVRLGLSESTVKAVVQRLFGKTGVRNRAQLVRAALERYRHLM